MHPVSHLEHLEPLMDPEHLGLLGHLEWLLVLPEHLEHLVVLLHLEILVWHLVLPEHLELLVVLWYPEHL